MYSFLLVSFHLILDKPEQGSRKFLIDLFRENFPTSHLNILEYSIANGVQQVSQRYLNFNSR